VPRDHVARRDEAGGKGAPQLEPFRITAQFVLAVGALFCIQCINEIVRLLTPIALKAIQDSANVASETGITFSLAGLVSGTGVLFVAPRVFTPGRVRWALGGACFVGACGASILALAASVPPYVVGFLVFALVVSSMVPAMNTLIASSVTRSRRGTGFGVAATMQAFSFVIGPGSAALFAGVSLDLGFAVVAGVFLALGATLAAAVRETKESSMAPVG
jgi:hypothetical protein